MNAMISAKHEIIEPAEDMDIMITYIDKHAISNYDTSLIMQGIPPHWHRSIEFSYIRKGEVNLWTGNKFRTLSAGDFIFVNSAEIHRLTSNHVSDCEIVLTILPYTTLIQFLPNIDDMFFDIYQHTNYPTRFYEIFSFFYEHTQHPQPYDRLKINSCIFELLHILCTQYLTTQKGNNSQQKIQHQLLDYIDLHYQNDISLKELSAIFHFNPEYLSRKFKEIFGMNFKSYLTQYRLQQSLDAIINTNDKIQDIALHNGFSSAKTYIIAFKQYFNITPYQYRLHHRQTKKSIHTESSV